jgi:hypothetical protein
MPSDNKSLSVPPESVIFRALAAQLLFVYPGIAERAATISEHATPRRDIMVKGLLLATAVAVSAVSAGGASDIVLLTDEASLQVEVSFEGSVTETFEDSWMGSSWGGTDFISKAIEVSETVEDDDFNSASASARAELENTSQGGETVWALAHTDAFGGPEIIPTAWARSEVRLWFEVLSASSILLELAIVAPEGVGGVSLYDETAGSMIYELSGHMTTSHSESLASGHVYELYLYGENQDGDGTGGAYADFGGSVAPEPAATATLLIGLAGLISRGRKAVRGIAPPWEGM